MKVQEETQITVLLFYDIGAGFHIFCMHNQLYDFNIRGIMIPLPSSFHGIQTSSFI